MALSGDYGASHATTSSSAFGGVPLATTTTTSAATTVSCLDAYEPLEIIGSGTFGVIRKVRRKADGKLFARKELKFERMSDRDRKQIVSEVNILRTLAHDHIVRYEERFVDRENAILYIVMEYCQGGDLGSQIRDCRKGKTLLAEDVVLDYLTQMIKGLDACHNASADNGQPRVILHRDLKPENIFLDGQQQIKIGDFGLSKEVSAHSFACTYVGTPYYMSPELATGAHYDVKSDIWALGCVAYELCALRPPFDATTQAELTRKIQLGHVPELPRGYSRMLGDLIRSMLSLDPSKRPTTRDLHKCPLIRIAGRKRDEQARKSDRRRDQALAEREHALKERETALLQREESLGQREAQLAEREAAFTRRQASWELERAEAAAMAAASASSSSASSSLSSGITSAASSTRAGVISSSSSNSLVNPATSTPPTSLHSRYDVNNSHYEPSSLRRLAARRASAGRMHSSPCVVMDTSDVSMRDASAWLLTGNHGLGDVREEATSTVEGLNKENKSRPSAGALRPRRSSPAKVAMMAAAHQRANAAMKPVSPFRLKTNNVNSASAAAGAATATGEESLPSPFLRKIMRTQSQPPCLPHASSAGNQAIAAISAVAAAREREMGPCATSLSSAAIVHDTASTTGTSPGTGIAHSDVKRLNTLTNPSSSSTASEDFTVRSRAFSAMPRRRQSIVPPGSIGVAPLGRKSGNEAISLRG